MSKLIGIGGRLAAGKDEVADFLVEKRGWMKLNMSAPLHEAALVLNPWIKVGHPETARLDYDQGMTVLPGHHTYRDLTETFGYTQAKNISEYRQFLQRLGTEVGRNMFGENVWTDIALRNIDRLRTHGDNVVITGIRFPNEVEMIKNSHGMDGDIEGGQLVWIDRPTLEKTSTHDSEKLTSEDFDITITNDGSLEDLYRKVADTLA